MSEQPASPSPHKLWDQANDECKGKSVDEVQKRYVELMKQHGFIVEKQPEPTPQTPEDELRLQVKKLTEENERLREHDRLVMRQMTDYGLHQVFTREVSAFHREALLPLIDVVKQITAQAAQNAPVEIKGQVEELNKFLKKIEERTKHFEGQSLVAKARQNAIDEQKKLETKISVSGERGEVKVTATGELAVDARKP